MKFRYNIIIMYKNKFFLCYFDVFVVTSSALLVDECGRTVFVAVDVLTY